MKVPVTKKNVTNKTMKSQFIEFLVRHNNLNRFGFDAWIFYPGMLFNDLSTWWGDRGVRLRAHEGLDFCFYRDTGGQDRSLREKTMIPMMYEGEIVRIGDDFLGKSIFVSHNIYDACGNRLHTIYGHMNPYSGVTIGKVVGEGELIATIADTGKRTTKIPPHVHISVAWMPKSFPYERLDWKTMSDRSVVTLCDPLEFIECKYKVERYGRDIIKA